MSLFMITSNKLIEEILRTTQVGHVVVDLTSNEGSEVTQVG